MPPRRDGTGLMPRANPSLHVLPVPIRPPPCCDLGKDRPLGSGRDSLGQGGHRTSTNNTRQLWLCFGKRQTTLPGGAGWSRALPEPTCAETAQRRGREVPSQPGWKQWDRKRTSSLLSQALTHLPAGTCPRHVSIGALQHHPARPRGSALRAWSSLRSSEGPQLVSSSSPVLAEQHPPSQWEPCLQPPRLLEASPTPPPPHAQSVLHEGPRMRALLSLPAPQAGPSVGHAGWARARSGAIY